MKTNKNVKDKTVSYATQIRHQYLLNGLAWILAGTFQLIPLKIFTALSCICLLAAMYLKTVDWRKSKETADEMAESNMNKAMAKTFYIGEMILLLFSIIVGNVMIEFMEMDLDINRYISPGIFVFVGLMDFLVGLFFKQEEEE